MITSGERLLFGRLVKMSFVGRAYATGDFAYKFTKTNVVKIYTENEIKKKINRHETILSIVARMYIGTHDCDVSGLFLKEEIYEIFGSYNWENLSKEQFKRKCEKYIDKIINERTSHYFTNCEGCKEVLYRVFQTTSKNHGCTYSVRTGEVLSMDIELNYICPNCNKILGDYEAHGI